MGDRVAALRRLGCLLVPGFAAAAAVRAEPALAGQPLVILDEARPGRLVMRGRRSGARPGHSPGMTEAAALARSGGVICRERVAAHESRRRRRCSRWRSRIPRAWRTAAPARSISTPAGLGALFGDEAALARRLAAATVAAGLPARVGIAGSRVAAHLAARWGAGAERVPPDEDAAYLAPAPLGLLGLPIEMARRLERWGLRTLGELAALPRASFRAARRRGAAAPGARARRRPAPAPALAPAAPLRGDAELDWGRTISSPSSPSSPSWPIASVRGSRARRAGRRSLRVVVPRGRRARAGARGARLLPFRPCPRARRAR